MQFTHIAGSWIPAEIKTIALRAVMVPHLKATVICCRARPVKCQLSTTEQSESARKYPELRLTRPLSFNLTVVTVTKPIIVLTSTQIQL